MERTEHLQQQQHLAVNATTTLSQGSREWAQRGRKSQDRNPAGRHPGFLFCSTLITTTMINMTTKGTPTPTRTCQPASDRLNMKRGNTKKQRMMYTAANQRAFASLSPGLAMAARMAVVVVPIHLSLQHGVKQLYNADQTGTENQQRESHQDETHSQIRQVRIHKEITFVASHLYDGLCEDVSDNVQQVWCFSTLDLKGVDDELGHTVQITAGHFQRQQHQNREPVKEVVHGGPRKSPNYIPLYKRKIVKILPAKRIAVSSLRHGDQCVCNRSANVGAHDDGNSHLDCEYCQRTQIQIKPGSYSLPEETMLTTIEEEVDELWTSRVTRTPMTKPARGLDKTEFS
ncbi:hypothetical protein CCH79_00012430 [Gambusia affinis]|uniref:Uncharacterized protein n=1 Tax=Gambusia affinis TaxID=33528 RepID=A0A315WCB8_GAMAF|nr:hypothetical protein CCH79_00012430 [Gambusia affinis]